MTFTKSGQISSSKGHHLVIIGNREQVLAKTCLWCFLLTILIQSPRKSWISCKIKKVYWKGVHLFRVSFAWCGDIFFTLVLWQSRLWLVILKCFLLLLLGELTLCHLAGTVFAKLFILEWFVERDFVESRICLDVLLDQRFYTRSF